MQSRPSSRLPIAKRRCGLTRTRYHVGTARQGERQLREMERLNAYATLIDPVKRRQYDCHCYATHGIGAAAAAHSKPLVVRMSIDCTLTQLGGYEAVSSVHEAFSCLLEALLHQ